MPEWRNRFSKEAVREIASQIVWSYWPYWGAPLVSAILTYSGDQPAAVIFLSALAAFALISLGLNNFSQWMTAQSVAGKVEFVLPVLAVKNDASKEPPELEGMKLGVALQNHAPFPVDVRIDRLEVQISDRVPGGAFFARSVTVGQRQGAQFTSALISLIGVERANQVLYGRINAEVTYGRPGKLRYPAERQWHMAIKFDKNGNFESAEPSLTEFAKEA